MQTRYDIIILNQTEDTVTLYCNCIKYGYTTLRYSHNDDPDTVIEIPLSTTETVVTGLLPGDYTFCAVDAEGKFSFPVFINIPAVSQSQFFANIITAANLPYEDCLPVLQRIKTKKYIEELYSLYKIRTKDPFFIEYGEAILSAFVSVYNLEQETLNQQFLFSFCISDNSITANDQMQYRFVPYVFDPTTKTWILEKENITDGTSFIINNNKPSVLRQILVMSDFNVVRKYFIYQPSKNASETILERRIASTKNRENELHNLLTDIDLTELFNDEVGQKAVLSLSHIMPARPLFKKPELSFDQEIGLVVTVPDYQAFTLSHKTVYLAALEIDEVFNEKPAPHKILVTSKNMTIRPASFLINSDLTYIFYLMDEKGFMLSEAVLFSFDDAFPAHNYTKSYMRIAYDKYVRRLNAIFRKYRKQDWDKISTILSRFLLTDISDITIEDFLIQQVLRLYSRDDRPDIWLQLILLCRLSYYADVDQSFIQNQVYSKEFGVHVLPEKASAYLIRITKINEEECKDEYLLGGATSTSIEINKDDYIVIQCIDPDTWHVSSIAFYNNRIKNGPRYLYFPNLKVEVI